MNRLPYVPPTLTQHGDLRRITAGGYGPGEKDQWWTIFNRTPDPTFSD